MLNTRNVRYRGFSSIILVFAGLLILGIGWWRFSSAQSTPPQPKNEKQSISTKPAQEEQSPPQATSTPSAKILGKEFIFDPKNNKGTEGLTKYFQDEPGFVIKPPLGWNKGAPISNDRVVFEMPNIKTKARDGQDVTYAVLIAVSARKGEGYDYEDWIPVQRDSIKEQVRKLVFLEDKDVMVDGVKARLFEYTGLPNDEGRDDFARKYGEDEAMIHNIEYIILKDDYVIILYTDAPKLYWNEVADKIKVSLASFRFLK